MRLDLHDPHPLHARIERESVDVQLLDPDKVYHLLVGVLDPTQRTTSAPVTGIEISGPRLAKYNRVLEGFQRISEQFYSTDGFVNHPELYTNEQQDRVLDAMARIGRNIYDLFRGVRPVRDWLDQLFESSEMPSTRQRPIQPVTIITNDFSVPWFWLNNDLDGPFLCEVCSLGLMQLSAAGLPRDAVQFHGCPDKRYEALLINGSSNLPFAEEEINTIGAVLQGSSRGDLHHFEAQRADRYEDIAGLYLKYPDEEQLNHFRIVHFSGHYSGKDLLLGGRPLPPHILYPILKDSLLVLDGCSSARGLKAWTDIEGLTSVLINKGGALGCVVTALPVKHDPIVSKVFWEAFYRDLRRGSSTIGQALVRARLALREHFNKIGSQNPAWALYQLIGSPAVHLCENDDESA
jgi:CHAT domain